MWRKSRMTHRQMLSLALLALIGCGIVIVRFPMLEETQGTATYFGNEFVIIDDGFRGDHITWVVVRNWPAKSSPSERLNDTRFDEVGSPRSVLLPNGDRVPLSRTPHVYFFDGPQLKIFPVKMTEDDITELHGHFRGMTDYREMLPLLRRFERRDE